MSLRRAISLLEQADLDDGGPDFDHALTVRYVRDALAELRKLDTAATPTVATPSPEDRVSR